MDCAWGFSGDNDNGKKEVLNKVEEIIKRIGQIT